MSKWRRAKCLLSVEQRYSRHQFRSISRDSDWTSNPVLDGFEPGRTDRAEGRCRNATLILPQVGLCLLSFSFSVARITRPAMNSELILFTQVHILTDEVFVASRILNQWSFVWRRRLPVFVVLLFGESRTTLHMFDGAPSCTRGTTRLQD